MHDAFKVERSGSQFLLICMPHYGWLCRHIIRMLQLQLQNSIKKKLKPYTQNLKPYQFKCLTTEKTGQE